MFKRRNSTTTTTTARGEARPMAGNLDPRVKDDRDHARKVERAIGAIGSPGADLLSKIEG